jgi:hypothetical protein
MNPLKLFCYIIQYLGLGLGAIQGTGARIPFSSDIPHPISFPGNNMRDMGFPFLMGMGMLVPGH